MESAAESLQIHDVVRVLSLTDPTAWVAANDVIGRSPRVGDEGRVVALDPTGQRVVVEMCLPSGYVVWQGTFASSDLQLVWRAGASRNR